MNLAPKFFFRSLPLLLLALLSLIAAPQARAQADNDQVDIGTIEAPQYSVPKDLTLRVRVTAMDPSEPTAIQWRYGGEGMGGDVIKGALSKSADNAKPALKDDSAASKRDVAALPQLQIGEWSAPTPLTTFVSPPIPSRKFITFWVGRTPKPTSVTDRTPINYAKNVTLEFEFSLQGKVIRTFSESSSDGSTVTLVIWPQRWTTADNKTDFPKGLMGLLEYVTIRADFLEALPWGKEGLPKKFAIVTDLTGYGVASGYGIHHSSRAVIDAEVRALRQLGVNGLRAMPAYLVDMMKKNQGPAAGLSTARIVQIPGYPVVPTPRKKTEDFEPGCPFSDKVPALTTTAITEAIDEMKSAGAPEVWGLTVDEIGVVFDQTNDGKAHIEKCPACTKAYVALLQSRGVTLAELGKKDWSEVRAMIVAKGADAKWMLDPQVALNAYYSRVFLAEASAGMFTPLRTAVASANAQRAQSAAAPTAAQPAMYTYALRGNTFLLGGHSLDFFDFYRKSDNGFVYETSNRDVRVHQWDSYLCDVGRVVSAENQLALGVYVKPHRGSVIQRAMTAISRGAGMLFWYTYGPDYSKGDCFSTSPAQMELTSKAAHLIAKSEDYLYGAKLAQRARIGLVKPSTTEIWLGLTGRDPAWTASWENAKWTYSALSHAHLSVDPLDETMLEKNDLSPYRVLYIAGPNLRRKSAERLTQWVQDGGTLYVSGWSMSRDEANRPLDSVLPLLGLESRSTPEMYLEVKCYSGGPLDRFDAVDRKHGLLATVPKEAAIQAPAPLSLNYTPKVGREKLAPAKGTEILGKFADGSPAITRHALGKGEVIVVGFFPALEYSAEIRNDEYDMSKQFDENLRRLITAPALAKVSPIVKTNVPTVEGVLLNNPTNNRKSVTLMNWTYRVGNLLEKRVGNVTRKVPLPAVVEQKDLLITIAGAGPVKKIRSALSGKDVPFTVQGDELRVTLPTLQEADVLLFD